MFLLERFWPDRFPNGTNNQWEELNGYMKRKQPIGHGTFGIVFYAKKDAQIFAIKKVLIQSKDHLKRTLQQIQLMKKLDSPFTVHIQDSFKIEEKEVYIVMQKCDNSLDEVLHLYDSEQKKMQISEKIMEAISFIHEMNVSHRDLKPQNILLVDGKVKISDFGLSREIPDGKFMSSDVGTRWYKAPEQFKSRNYDERVDGWALALILLEIQKGKRIDQITQFTPALTQNFPSPQLVASIKNPQIREIIKKLLIKDPKERGKVTEIYQQYLKNKLIQNQVKTIQQSTIHFDIQNCQ